MFSEHDTFKVVAAEPPDAAPGAERVGVQCNGTACRRGLMLFIPPRVRVRRSDLDRRHGDQGGLSRRSWEAELPLAAAPRDGERCAARKERDVRSETSGKVEQLMTRDGV